MLVLYNKPSPSLIRKMEEVLSKDSQYRSLRGDVINLLEQNRTVSMIEQLEELTSRTSTLSPITANGIIYDIDRLSFFILYFVFSALIIVVSLVLFFVYPIFLL